MISLLKTRWRSLEPLGRRFALGSGSKLEQTQFENYDELRIGIITR